MGLPVEVVRSQSCRKFPSVQVRWRRTNLKRNSKKSWLDKSQGLFWAGMKQQVRFNSLIRLLSVKFNLKLKRTSEFNSPKTPTESSMPLNWDILDLLREFTRLVCSLSLQNNKKRVLPVWNSWSWKSCKMIRLNELNKKFEPSRIRSKSSKSCNLMCDFRRLGATLIQTKCEAHPPASLQKPS